MNQAELRQFYLQQRNGFSSDYQHIASHTICEKLFQSSLYQQAHRIAVYLAIGKEINLKQLIGHAWRDGKQIYLPRLDTNKDMDFALHTPDSHLITNKYGIAEPSAHAATIDIKQLDIVCLPLVAFDKNNNRIGMGGGYYDRALANVAHSIQPIRIGIAYKEQETNDCHANAWDIPLHHVIHN